MRTAHASAPVQPPPFQPAPSAPFWTNNGKEIVTAVVGPFVGALAAFGLGLLAQRRSRIDAEKAAGNLAMSVLAKQLDDFKNAQRVIFESREEKKSQPDWLQLLPMYYHFSDSLKFDLQSLAFLFREGEATLVSKLMKAEMRYHDMARVMSVHAAAAEEVQKRLEAGGLTHGSAVTVEDAERLVGPALVAKMSNLTASLYQRMDEDEKDYRDAIDTLDGLMERSFGKKGRVKIVVKEKAVTAAASPAPASSDK
jgi:hypothetical protein